VDRLVNNTGVSAKSPGYLAGLSIESFDVDFSPTRAEPHGDGEGGR
jgi:hypothetical protein